MIVDSGQGKHYLYRHIRLDTNEVFYIGIGTLIVSKGYQRANCKNRNKLWQNITKKTKYEIEILLESNDYEFIKLKEIEFIKLYGRRDLGLGTLVNMTDGGDGALGNKQSFETVEKRVSKLRGSKRTEEYKLKMSNSRKGMFYCPECVEAQKIKVYRYNKDLEFIDEWESMSEIERKIGISTSEMSRVLKGKRQSARGFIWKLQKL